MTSSIAAFFSMMNPDSQPITPEAVATVGIIASPRPLNGGHYAGQNWSRPNFRAPVLNWKNFSGGPDI
jgi:hypothetical protein